MRKCQCLLAIAALFMASCIDDVDNSSFFKKYLAEFSNRTSIAVNISTAQKGQFYAIYYGNPYDDEGSLVKQPALTGVTPISATLDVPNDVTQLYLLTSGNIYTYGVENLTITPSTQLASRAYTTQTVSSDVMTQVNSVYFPEKTNNVRGDNLLKCTDLVISQTAATGNFEVAEVWLTFLGDGGARLGKLYGKIWCYTYPSEKRETLTADDCTFYGVVNDEVVPVTYADLQAGRKWVFYAKDEISNNISSYKKFKLGEFAKGLNVGFAFIGNSKLRFTTPHLNPVIPANTKITYKDNSGTYTFASDCYAPNGFICHVKVDDFEGNILGMENRLPTEKSYDGDYNDILCLVESNPKTIKPNEDVTIGNSDGKEDVNCTTTTGLYLYEDNYPSPGDFDFNDAVIRYQIKDYYKSSNQAKQITVQLYAKGAGMSNSFGFRNKGNFVSFLTNLDGYENVYVSQTFAPIGNEVVQTLYGDAVPCMKNGKDYFIYDTNVNTTKYPCVLDIPLSDPDDPDWKFEWSIEKNSIDDCYYFLKNATGGSRDKDWYKHPKDESLLFQR